MSLRKRLILLLGIFALYAVVAASITIYGNQWHIKNSLVRFERAIGQTMQIDRLHLLLAEQMFHLSELVEGQTGSLDLYSSSRDEFFANLQQATAFAPDARDGWDRTEIVRLAESFENESNRCLALIEAESREEASDVLATRLQEKLVPELRARLIQGKVQLSAIQNESARELDVSSSRMLVGTVAVGILAAALTIVGALLIHRWLMSPLGRLQEAARHYSEGDLAYRTSETRRDELGELGIALNNMARTVAASEQKHRTLFANLRDAVVICDGDGMIIEYHDGDARLLSVEEGQNAGRYLLDVWPEWRSVEIDWPVIIHAAIADGRRQEVIDVSLSRPGQQTNDTYVDFVVYRVDYGEQRHVAIVVRDASERNRLQRRARRAETMEAVGVMAGGLAHDVNNLLSSVMGALSTLASEQADSEQTERIQAALKTCRRAAGLTKRLLNFAHGAHGTRQVFAPGDVIETILDSLDPEFLEAIELEEDLDRSAFVQMDQDQFAQIVLNLLRNAHDAMDAGGRLWISLRTTLARNPDTAAPERPYVCLEVRDSGVGMSPDIKERVFEPFFSTKSRTGQHGRGMGMAVVYSAVSNAGGFVRIESEPSVGTTVRVCIPLVSSVEVKVQPSEVSAAPTN